MQPNAQLTKRKKLLVAAAIFALPALALAIIIFSFMHKPKKTNSTVSGASAFNTHLPAAPAPPGEKNKLEIYMQAQQDSQKLNDARAHDPYIHHDTTISPVPFNPKAPFASAGAWNGPAHAAEPYMDANEKKVNEHLQRLYSVIKSTDGSGQQNPYMQTMLPPPSGMLSPQTEKLERLMTLLQQKDTATDPQLAAASKVLDKIIQIRTLDHNPQPTPADSSLPKGQYVQTRPIQLTVPDDSLVVEAGNGFFGMTEEEDTSNVATNVVKAVVPIDQTVLSGSTVRLRLLQDVYIGTARIPANSFIYGTCAIEGERVMVKLSDAIYKGSIYPIRMSVYDGVDGLAGLYVPGALTRDVVKEGVGQGVGGVSIGSLDPSLGAQAAQAGIETVKTLLTRKIRLVKATLRAGHIVVLKYTTNVQ